MNDGRRSIDRLCGQSSSFIDPCAHTHGRSERLLQARQLPVTTEPTHTRTAATANGSVFSPCLQTQRGREKERRHHSRLKVRLPDVAMVKIRVTTIDALLPLTVRGGPCCLAVHVTT